MTERTWKAGNPGRVIGFDLARALAIFGMVLVNFKVVMTLGDSPEFIYWLAELDPDPAWLIRIAQCFEGRAAATFVMLAGAGLSLMAAGAESPESLRAVRMRLWKRAIFLLATGLLYYPLWPGDILHYYGFFIAIGAFMLKVSGRKLWLAAAACASVFVALLFTFDYETSWNWTTLDYADFWTWRGFARNTFFNGFHPVFPWLAFLLAGMWIGRQKAQGSLNAGRLFWIGLAIALAAEGTSRLAIAAVGADLDAHEPGLAEALLGTKSMPPMPLYLMAAGGTAVAVICLCLGAAERWPGAWWLKALAATGRLAFTFYVGHVVVGMGLLLLLGRLEDQSLAFSLACAAVFFLLAVAFAAVWTRRFRLGPLEWIMRRLAG